MKKYLWSFYNYINYKNKPYRNAFKVFAGRFEYPVDRFGVTQGKLEVDTFNIVKDPIYNLNNLTNDWEDRYYSIVDQVADNVYSTAGNRKILVLYSGGIDSMLIILALQKHKRYKEFIDANRLEVMMTSSSIGEDTNFFYNNILHNINFVPLSYSQAMNDEEVLLVTGDMGDHIIGSSDILKKKIVDFDPMVNWSKLEIPGLVRYNEILNLCVKSCPFEIVSANQASWWWAQCFDHQDDLLKPYFWSDFSNFSDVGNNNKVFRFFYDDLFVKFSFEYMSTNPTYRNYNENKLFPKKYICNQTGKLEYLDKIKIFSQRQTYRVFYKKCIYSENDQINYESCL
jgi:hypothetical protein